LATCSASARISVQTVSSFIRSPNLGNQEKERAENALGTIMKL
jgi:hypothetical protein